MSVSAPMHCALAPPAVSPTRPSFLFARSHAVASCSRSRPMVLLTHAVDVPEPSASRYWCISYTILSEGSVSPAMPVAVPLDTQCHAPDHELPSTKMYCDVAPAARMPSMAAWLSCATSVLSMSWYSLLVSKTTLALSLKWAATVVHQAWNPAVSVMTWS
ncbi:hypothetical protein SPBR_01087 [Sporothrix brasiliensis 5110]|uniref:Uncharacterized protein n=1 Tax=Sporothrix brasiliensis 5110 TaxID=1398154 RepID=A0A0C2FFH7_9PEZI|nr:uncharacterized protein SPBR_01087 [Sporothrix brasiliensis 5110]KIH89888.1 hypothetical protein SPBR_01087 [Sporothrix brasiliensis 5110]